jgi:hypothetical protein
MNDASAWDGDWAWSLPLIVLTVVFHVIGLGLFNVRSDQVLAIMRTRRNYEFIFVFFMGVTAMWATFLHAVEAGVWAVAYRSLGALPDNKSAMLYSLSAITTYGHSELFLEEHWRLMGALEVLNGIMLFGLTTAFMYGMIQRVWPIETRRGYKDPAASHPHNTPQ